MMLSEAIELVYDTVRIGIDPAVSYGFGQESFDKPTDALWTRVTVVPLAPAGASHGPAGARAKQGRGIIWCQAFAPLVVDGVAQDGIGRALALAQQLGVLFEGRDIPATPGAEAINVETAAYLDGGFDSAWYRYDARLSFTYQQTF